MVSYEYKNTISFNGYSYNKKRVLKNGTIMYNCKYNRDGKECKNKIYMKDNKVVKTEGDHSDNCSSKSLLGEPISENCDDIVDAMKEFVDNLAIENRTLSAKEIWKLTREHFLSNPEIPVKCLHHHQVINRVHNKRYENFVGKDSKFIVEDPAVSLIKSKFFHVIIFILKNIY